MPRFPHPAQHKTKRGERKLDNWKKRLGSLFLAVVLLVAFRPEMGYAGGWKETFWKKEHTSELELKGTVGLSGAQLTLKVTVVRKDSKTPISGVKITLREEARNAEATAETDQNGHVWIKNLCDGETYTITAVHEGYQTRTETHTYEADQSLEYPVWDELEIQMETKEDDSGDSGGSTGGNSGGSSGENNPGGGSGNKPGGGSGGGSGNKPTGNPGSNPGNKPGGSLVGAAGNDPDGSLGGNTGSTSVNGSGNGLGGSGNNWFTGWTGNKKNDKAQNSQSGEEEQTGSMIDLRAEEGEDTIGIPRPVMEESAENDMAIRLIFPNEDGTEEILVIPAFTEHDFRLTGNGLFTVSRTESGWLLIIKVPKEEEKETLVGVPHSLIRLVEDNDMDVNVVYEDDTERNFRMSAEHMIQIVPDNGDLIFGYDREAEQAYMGIEVQSTAHGITDHAVLSKTAFLIGRDVGIGLLCRIIDPDAGEELCYEWSFAPEALKNAWAEDCDLYICSTPDRNDPVVYLTKDIRSQYLILSNDGAFPAEAKLRVRNLERFPSEQAMSLVRAGGTSGESSEEAALESIQTGLLPDEEGYYECMLTQGGSYALIRESDHMEALSRVHETEGGLPVFLLLAAGLGLLLLVIFLILLLKRKEEEEEETEDGADEGLYGSEKKRQGCRRS